MKKLLSVFVVLGFVSSVSAVDSINVAINLPASEEGTLSEQAEDVVVEAVVKPYDEERVQVDIEVSQATEEATRVFAKRRIIGYRGDDAVTTITNGDEEFEMTVSVGEAKEASMKVEVVSSDEAADEEEKEEAAQDA